MQTKIVQSTTFSLSASEVFVPLASSITYFFIPSNAPLADISKAIVSYSKFAFCWSPLLKRPTSKRPISLKSLGVIFQSRFKYTEDVTNISSSFLSNISMQTWYHTVPPFNLFPRSIRLETDYKDAYKYILSASGASANLDSQLKNLPTPLDASFASAPAISGDMLRVLRALVNALPIFTLFYF